MNRKIKQFYKHWIPESYSCVEYEHSDMPTCLKNGPFFIQTNDDFYRFHTATHTIMPFDQGDRTPRTYCDTQ